MFFTKMIIDSAESLELGGIPMHCVGLCHSSSIWAHVMFHLCLDSRGFACSDVRSVQHIFHVLSQRQSSRSPIEWRLSLLATILVLVVPPLNLILCREVPHAKAGRQEGCVLMVMFGGLQEWEAHARITNRLAIRQPLLLLKKQRVSAKLMVSDILLSKKMRS